MLRTAAYCVIGMAFGAVVALMLHARPEATHDLIKGGALSGVLAGMMQMGRPSRKS